MKAKAMKLNSWPRDERVILVLLLLLLAHAPRGGAIQIDGVDKVKLYPQFEME